MELPDPVSLRCFTAAARLLSFNRAARRVSLTPAALGQRIAGLERQLGRELFRRTGRGVTLTDAGVSFLPSAERALDELADCLQMGRGDPSPAAAEITLGTRHEMGMQWVLPLLRRLRRRLPHLTLHLYFGSGADLLLRVRSREIDCAVGSMRIHDSVLSVIQLHRHEYVLVGSPALLARQPLTEPGHAAQHTLIDVDATLPLFAYYRDAPGGHALPFRRFLYMGAVAAIRSMVLAGDGIAVLPAWLVGPDLRAGKLRPIFEKVQPLHDYFRLFHRADDPRRSLFESLANEMHRSPDDSSRRSQGVRKAPDRTK